MLEQTEKQRKHRDGVMRGHVTKAAKRAGVTVAEYQERRAQGLKSCSLCGKWAPATPEHFVTRNRLRGGVAAYCLDCHRADARERYRRAAVWPKRKFKKYEHEGRQSLLHRIATAQTTMVDNRTPDQSALLLRAVNAGLIADCRYYREPRFLR